MKKNASYHILRVAIGITFLWIGVLILKDPLLWGGFIQDWALTLIPIPLKEAMIGTAVLDILVGFFLLVDMFAWIAGAVGAAHLVVVITTSGIGSVTVRDIGLMGGAIAIALTSWHNRK